MKRFTPITQFVFTIAVLLALTFTAQAQIDTIDTERSSVTFSLSGQNTNSIVALTAGKTLKSINGHGAIYLARQTADGEVTSEIVNAEVQGQWKFIEVIVSVERDIHRGIKENSKPHIVPHPAHCRSGTPD